MTLQGHGAPLLRPDRHLIGGGPPQGVSWAALETLALGQSCQRLSCARKGQRFNESVHEGFKGLPRDWTRVENCNEIGRVGGVGGPAIVDARRANALGMRYNLKEVHIAGAFPIRIDAHAAIGGPIQTVEKLMIIREGMDCDVSPSGGEVSQYLAGCVPRPRFELSQSCGSSWGHFLPSTRTIIGLRS